MTLERLMSDLAITSFMVFVGVVWLYGTRYRWSVFDPPERWWWIDSSAMVKKLFGNKIAIGLSYLTGSAFVGVGLSVFVVRLVELGRRLGYWN